MLYDDAIVDEIIRRFEDKDALVIFISDHGEEVYDTGLSLAQAAREAGLREICFTDHRDYDPCAQVQTMLFDPRAYSREYDSLEIPGLEIRRGMEFGMTPENRDQFREDLKLRT